MEQFWTALMGQKNRTEEYKPNTYNIINLDFQLT